MKAGTTEKVKFLTFQRRLGLRKWEAVGILESIWQLTARDAPRGNVGRYTDEEIAAAIDYQGNEGELIDALIASGWLDECQEYRLIIHGWAEHCPTYIRGNLERHGRDFAKQAPKDGAKQAPKDPPKDVTKEPPKDGATKPSLAKPSQAKPSQANKARPQARADVANYLQSLGEENASNIADAFWDHYSANGWRVGRVLMRDWKAAARNARKWERVASKNGNGKPAGRGFHEYNPDHVPEFMREMLPGIGGPNDDQ